MSSNTQKFGTQIGKHLMVVALRLRSIFTRNQRRLFWLIWIKGGSNFFWIN